MPHQPWSVEKKTVKKACAGITYLPEVTLNDLKGWTIQLILLNTHL